MDKLVEANQRALDLQYMLDSAQQEIERLRAALAHELDLRNRHIESLEARIKELEAAYKIFLEANEKTNALEKDSTEKIVAALRLFDDLEAYTKRLEAAFLEQFVQGIQAPREMAELMARDALGRIADRDSWIGRYEAVRKEKDARIADQEAYIERLEAAFLEEYQRGCVMLSPNAAKEALERIKEGGKDE